MTLIEKADTFALAAHSAVGQVRKYTNEPYINHPREVAQLVASVGGSDVMVAAALLHDVLEDTMVSYGVVEDVFGSTVARLVGWLTDVSKPEDGNRAARKAIDRDHIASAPPEAKTIKLADLISNTRSIVKYDRGFARVYLAEKRLLLTFLNAGNEVLCAKAWHLLEEGLKEINRD